MDGQHICIINNFDVTDLHYKMCLYNEIYRRWRVTLNASIMQRPSSCLQLLLLKMLLGHLSDPPILTPNHSTNPNRKRPERPKKALILRHLLVLQRYDIKALIIVRQL